MGLIPSLTNGSFFLFLSYYECFLNPGDGTSLQKYRSYNKNMRSSEAH